MNIFNNQKVLNKNLSEIKRCRKFAEYEKLYLIKLINRHPDVKDNKLGEQSLTRKRRAWEDVLFRFNAGVQSGDRTMMQIKNLFKNLKKNPKYSGLLKENVDENFDEPQNETVFVEIFTTASPSPPRNIPKEKIYDCIEEVGRFPPTIPQQGNGTSSTSTDNDLPSPIPNGNDFDLDDVDMDMGNRDNRVKFLASTPMTQTSSVATKAREIQEKLIKNEEIKKIEEELTEVQQELLQTKIAISQMEVRKHHLKIKLLERQLQIEKYN